MKIDLDYLRRHYESLSDEALAEVNPADLVDAARECYEHERRRRGHFTADDVDEVAERPAGRPEWADASYCVMTFQSEAAAEQARKSLADAGIACYVDRVENEAQGFSMHGAAEYRLLTPPALNLTATAIIERDIVNPELEAEWREHLETLSDAELAGVAPSIVCSSFTDRMLRYTRAHAEESTRRKLTHQ